MHEKWTNQREGGKKHQKARQIIPATNVCANFGANLSDYIDTNGSFLQLFYVDPSEAVGHDSYDGLKAPENKGHHAIHLATLVKGSDVDFREMIKAFETNMEQRSWLKFGRPAGVFL